MSESKKVGFVSAMKSYFGLKEGQSISQFAAEIKDLTLKDKQEFHQMMVAEGIDCDPPVEPKKS